MACVVTAEKRKSGSHWCVTLKSWPHWILTRCLRNLTLCFCGLRRPKLSVVVSFWQVFDLFSVFDFLKCFLIWICASYSHREPRTDRARQPFFLQALNVCVETSFLLGLLKWAIAVSASYLRQESGYCFSTALQQATDLQWPGVYSVSHDSKHLELPHLLKIQSKW